MCAKHFEFPLFLPCHSLFQLLQAFYRQQDEIRGLREELNHKDVSIRTHQAANICQNTLRCNLCNQTVMLFLSLIRVGILMDYIDPDCFCCAGQDHSAGAGDQIHPKEHEGDLLIQPISSHVAVLTLNQSKYSTVQPIKERLLTSLHSYVVCIHTFCLFWFFIKCEDE